MGWTSFVFVKTSKGVGLFPCMVLFDKMSPKTRDMQISFQPDLNFADIDLNLEDFKIQVSRAVMMFFYLTLQLISKSTHIVPVPAPDALNKKRVRNNKPPIDSYRQVTIVPERFIKGTKNKGSEGRKSPLTYCRSHERHYDSQTPKSVWCHDKEYHGKKGWWIVIIPGHFRGSSEYGTITHDYIVH